MQILTEENHYSQFCKGNYNATFTLVIQVGSSAAYAVLGSLSSHNAEAELRLKGRILFYHIQQLNGKHQSEPICNIKRNSVKLGITEK